MRYIIATILLFIVIWFIHDRSLIPCSWYKLDVRWDNQSLLPESCK